MRRAGGEDHFARACCRAGSYLCTTDKGMSVCENLRQKGKPI